jgi:hypothetical protein
MMKQQIEKYEITHPTVTGHMLYTSTDQFTTVTETDFIPHHRAFTKTFYTMCPFYVVMCLRFTETAVYK